MKAEPPPTRSVGRDSGTDNANGGWLQQLVRQHGQLTQNHAHVTRCPWYEQAIPMRYDSRIHNDRNAFGGYHFERLAIQAPKRTPITTPAIPNHDCTRAAKTVASTTSFVIRRCHSNSANLHCGSSIEWRLCHAAKSFSDFPKSSLRSNVLNSSACLSRGVLARSISALIWLPWSLSSGTSLPAPKNKRNVSKSSPDKPHPDLSNGMSSGPMENSVPLEICVPPPGNFNGLRSPWLKSSGAINFITRVLSNSRV